MCLIMRTKDFIYRHLFGMKVKRLAETKRNDMEHRRDLLYVCPDNHFGYIWFSDIHKVSPYMDAVRTLKGSGYNP